MADRAHKPIPVPAIPVPDGAEQSTQAAFGKILFELAKGNCALAARILTTSPDVTVSTNLGAVRGQRVSPLGTDRFGQTGTLPKLYREYRLDADAIVEAASSLLA